MPTRLLERRNRKGDIEFRDVEGDDAMPIAVGHAAVFGMQSVDLAPSWADYTVHEIIDPHAFDRTVREADVVGLFNHDDMWLLGRTTSGTVRLAVDERGLAYEIDLPDTTHGRDVAFLLRRGDVNGSSFAFRAIRDTWFEDEEGNITRTLLEVALIDVSPVTHPAYPDTDSSLRSLAAAIGTDLAEARRLVETRSLGQFLVPPEQREKQAVEPGSDPPEDPALPDPEVLIARRRLAHLYV